MSRPRRQEWAGDSTVSVDLSSGGSITLQFKGNLFDLSDDEHKLVGDLRAIIQQYREREIEPGRLAPALPVREVQHG